MESCKPVSTPMEYKLQNEMIRGKPFRITTFRQAIDSMMYLMVRARPDFAFAVFWLLQFLEQLTTVPKTCVKRVLRFVRNTIRHRISFKASSDSLAAIEYCSPGWARCKLDQKSTSGYVYLLAVKAVLWKSKRRSIVTVSTAEADYLGLTSAAP